MNDQPHLELWIEGTPAPGGSKTAFVARRGDGSFVMRPGTNVPVINMTDAGKLNKVWRKTVGMDALRQCRAKGWTITDRPVKCVFNFWMRRPNDHFQGNNRDRPLKEGAPRYHDMKPDVLKLARSTEDALTGVVWKDDAQVVAQTATKQFCNPGERTGCRVRVTLL